MRAESRWLRHGDASLHLADFGGAGPTLVFVHGLGGSHANFSALGPLLAERMRVLALDLPGFGLSHPGAGCNVPAFVEAVSRVLDAIGAGELEGASLPVTLVGNSMGGAVSILTASKRASSVARLVLICPALPLAKPLDADPRFALLILSSMLPGYDAFLRRRLRQAGPAALVHDMLDLTCADKTRVPASAIADMLELAERRSRFSWMASSFSEAARSIVRTLLARDTYQAAMRAVGVPVLLVHGDRDRLVPVSSARAAGATCPGWELEIYEGVGHVPQLETPQKLAETIRRFVG
jgi:pimeloyl-ACP methyl ester carboxylesterase